MGCCFVLNTQTADKGAMRNDQKKVKLTQRLSFFLFFSVLFKVTLIYVSLISLSANHGLNSVKVRCIDIQMHFNGILDY